MIRRPPRSTLFPYTDALPIYRSGSRAGRCGREREIEKAAGTDHHRGAIRASGPGGDGKVARVQARKGDAGDAEGGRAAVGDRKSVVWGKSVDLGGRRIIKKKSKGKSRTD